MRHTINRTDAAEILLDACCCVVIHFLEGRLEVEEVLSALQRLTAIAEGREEPPPSPTPEELLEYARQTKRARDDRR